MPNRQEPKKITNSKPIPHIPLAIQGSDGGRAQGEAAGEGDASGEGKKTL